MISSSATGRDPLIVAATERCSFRTSETSRWWQNVRTFLLHVPSSPSTHMACQWTGLRFGGETGDYWEVRIRHLWHLPRPRFFTCYICTCVTSLCWDEGQGLMLTQADMLVLMPQDCRHGRKTRKLKEIIPCLYFSQRLSAWAQNFIHIDRWRCWRISWWTAARGDYNNKQSICLLSVTFFLWLLILLNGKRLSLLTLFFRIHSLPNANFFFWTFCSEFWLCHCTPPNTHTHSIPFHNNHNSQPCHLFCLIIFNFCFISIQLYIFKSQNLI